MTDPVVEETVKGHKRLERNITLLAIGTFVTVAIGGLVQICLLYTSPSPRDRYGSRMPSSA